MGLGLRITLEVREQDWYLRGRGASFQLRRAPPPPIMHQPQCFFLPAGVVTGWQGTPTPGLALLPSSVACVS